MPFINELDFRVIGPYKRELLADFTYVDKDGTHYTAPKGDVTDGGSIPRWAWSFVGGPFSGLYLKPAVIHDNLCRTKIVSRKLADKIFLRAMKDNKVNWFKRWYMYKAVKLLSMGIKIKKFFSK